MVKDDLNREKVPSRVDHGGPELEARGVGHHHAVHQVLGHQKYKGDPLPVHHAKGCRATHLLKLVLVDELAECFQSSESTIDSLCLQRSLLGVQLI